jgi:hypothetical protein
LGKAYAVLVPVRPFLLGFADAPLLLAALKNGAAKDAERSDDPETQAEWLKAVGVAEDCG